MLIPVPTGQPVCLWAGSFTSLRLGFLISKMGTVTEHSLKRELNTLTQRAENNVGLPLISKRSPYYFQVAIVRASPLSPQRAGILLFSPGHPQNAACRQEGGVGGGGGRVWKPFRRGVEAEFAEPKKPPRGVPGVNLACICLSGG